MPLKRLETQKLQKESILAVDGIVNAMNCEFRTHFPDNAGIDGEIDLVMALAFQGKILRTQIKAGTSYITADREDYVRVKIERKYVELWKDMNTPVILFFYHPDTKLVYWKSVQDYLKCDPQLLKKNTKSVIFPFDKVSDLFTPEAIGSLRMVADGQFGYEKIIFTMDSKEEVLSNWFPVRHLPKKVYIAPTSYWRKREITNQLDNYYTFILKSKNLYTFSDLTSQDCELRGFCDCGSLQLSICQSDEIEDIRYMELLNRAVAIFGWQNDMLLSNERYYFSPNVLQDRSKSRFEFKPLRRDSGRPRSKIYISRSGSTFEYKHMAVRLAFMKLGEQWYFQIEPDWHFSYPYDPYKTRKEIGIRITKEKAGMFNGEYLYLLHAWKQFLSNSSDSIVFPCDGLPGCQEIVIDTSSKSFVSDFMLFNDYFGPKKA